MPTSGPTAEDEGSSWRQETPTSSPQPVTRPKRKAPIAPGPNPGFEVQDNVVEGLEAGLWCFDRTGTFRETILTAANLGDDADTTAGICGQVAGAFNGSRGIPASWLSKLSGRGMFAVPAHRPYAAHE